MTDEELHRLEIRYSDMESWDDAKQLVVECRRLRAENQRLLTVIATEADRLETAGYGVFAELLRDAAIEGK